MLVGLVVEWADRSSGMRVRRWELGAPRGFGCGAVVAGTDADGVVAFAASFCWCRWFAVPTTTRAATTATTSAAERAAFRRSLPTPGKRPDAPRGCRRGTMSLEPPPLSSRDRKDVSEKRQVIKMRVFV